MLVLVATQVVTAAELSVEALANYEGADRTQRLIVGAKKEGTLNLYTSLTVEDMTVLNAAFEKATGIKVRMWRASCDKVLQRVLAEYKAGRAEGNFDSGIEAALQRILADPSFIYRGETESAALAAGKTYTLTHTPR